MTHAALSGLTAGLLAAALAVPAAAAEPAPGSRVEVTG